MPMTFYTLLTDTHAQTLHMNEHIMSQFFAKSLPNQHKIDKTKRQILPFRFYVIILKHIFI